MITVADQKWIATICRLHLSTTERPPQCARQSTVYQVTYMKNAAPSASKLTEAMHEALRRLSHILPSNMLLADVSIDANAILAVICHLKPLTLMAHAQNHIAGLQAIKLPF